jgi:2-oxoglutarate dehydrogenase E2 component (dihydrolipoamide succinyltransferase)
MTTEIIVPSPGESITEVEIADWLVADGQEVKADDALCEIESEKVTLTVYAEAAGVVEQQAAAGDTVAVGAVIGHIKESSQPNDSAATVAKPEVKADVAQGNEDQAASGAGKTEDNISPVGETAGDTPEAKEDILRITVPSPGESVSEVEISTWLKSDGDSVRKDEEIAEIESEKVTLTLYAEAAGVLRIKVAAGETIAVGSEVGHIDLSRAAVDSSERRASAVTEGEAPPPREQASSRPAKKAAAPQTPQKNIANGQSHCPGPGRSGSSAAPRASRATKPIAPQTGRAAGRSKKPNRDADHFQRGGYVGRDAHPQAVQRGVSRCL